MEAMSQMCPSSSHQLVAAAIAFRRARKKFPKNVGQPSWPVGYERKDSKSVGLESMKMCNKCEQRFARQQEIRNVRSNDVWPEFTTSWSTNPPSTISMRENCTWLGRRKVPTITKMANSGGCACRRITRSTKRNVVVTFGDDGKTNNRRSGGDGFADGPTSVETIFGRSCKIHGNKPSVCNFFEKREDFNVAQRKRNETKSKTIKYSENKNWTKNDNLDLLYDRSCRTNNSLSFSSNPHDENSSPDNEDESLNFPNKIHEWENRAREESIGSATGCQVVIVGEEAFTNCHCTRKHDEETRSENPPYKHRQRSRAFRHKKKSIREEEDEELLPKSAASRASSFKESNRLCKDCALGQCPRNSAQVLSHRENNEAEEEEDERRCGGRVVVDNDACAIKHKDSMALLVEKFKNKKSPSCYDEQTIFKSNEDSASGTKMNEKTIAKRIGDKQEYADDKEFHDEDVTWCKIHRSTALEKTNKFHNRTSLKNFKSRKIPSGCCCSAKQVSCRDSL